MIARRLHVIEGDETLADPAYAAPAEGSEIKVAFATDDLVHVNAHFAGARTLAVYAVSPERARFLEAIQFEPQRGHGGDGGVDGIGVKIEAIKDCAVLVVEAIGGPAAARVVNHRIHPLKAQGGETIARFLDRLRTALDGTPPPWLRRALRKNETRNFSFLDEAADG